MAFMNSLNIGGSALSAQKLRMNIISQNIANANATRTESGGPYTRKQVILAENVDESFGTALNRANETIELSGVAVAGVVKDENPLKAVYNPSHPDADQNGYVMMPNVDTTKEMVEMISATRSYEANVTAFNALKLIASKALEIGK
jgi:flagellar basal-body rod protein FlgC